MGWNRWCSRAGQALRLDALFAAFAAVLPGFAQDS
jgi:hypothetical protein